uniref:Tetraspanin n=1 Tax=Palpitomonas bilix TaxID=652834 RepID=A0A7S3LWY8_9EUKA|mmetsp:Transcript_7559/g.19575  ORF Transcript_7559/g.19575 Transcript_7559/m.19575 type:complete len:271 (+) Transcript_7559:58-870(+)|eukprot:CAMPEP_0113899318 /NCGR_PEP_ID=MMETSP0780_2-20120614/19948_1 /TAXON_ID=652834 /ORGANISM="Palpitomonas bilix" /LENGTH=270 /DNA_ID=CAMNT_0000891439 /DNA_START=49 /DNA_END=861 /DNA_ORIENTATION=+ /assembly_acc=CAM_ASM_000599
MGEKEKQKKLGCAGGLCQMFLTIVDILLIIVGLATMIAGIVYKIRVGAPAPIPTVNFTCSLSLDSFGEFNLAGCFDLACEYLNMEAEVCSTLRNFPLVMIILGVILFLVGFVGYVAALKRNICLLGVFFIFVLVLTIIEIAMIITGYVKVGGLASEVQGYWVNATSANLTTIMTKFDCCGYPNKDENMPAGVTCSNLFPTTSDTVEGCKTQVFSIITDNPIAVSITAIIVALVEILCMLGSCVVIRKMRKKRAGSAKKEGSKKDLKDDRH